MMDVFTRHARLTRDHWNAVCNDELPERMPFAEEVQRDPISVIRTIPAREIAGWFAVFGLLAVVAAGLAVIA